MPQNKGQQLQDTMTDWYTLKLSDKMFSRFSSFIYKNLGIHLPREKKIMLQYRLVKRLKKLKMERFEDYFSYLTSVDGLKNELPLMINVVTTNKTDFFREPYHFQYLSENVLPKFCKNSNTRPFKIWSSACSTGAEPYTMAMILQEFAEKNRRFRYSILSTDISSKALKTAINAIYDHEMAESIPINLRKKYLLKKRNNKQTVLVRIVPELRQNVKFKQMNLMLSKYPVDSMMDVIFCRNVIIYFDRKTQDRVIKKLSCCLNPGGYLFMGHSESIKLDELPFERVQSTIYRKKNDHT